MYGHWKRRSDSLVQMTVEGEVEGKARPGKQVGLITSGNGQREEWSWLEKRHTRECRRFYKDYGNTAAAGDFTVKNAKLKREICV